MKPPRQRQSMKSLITAHRALQHRQGQLFDAARERYDHLANDIPDMAQHIKQKGIGGDPSLEDQYMQALQERHALLTGPIALQRQMAAEQEDNKRLIPQIADAAHGSKAMLNYYGRPGGEPGSFSHFLKGGT